MTSTTVTPRADATVAGPGGGASSPARILLHVFLTRDRPGLAVPGAVGGVQLLPRLRLHLGHGYVSLAGSRPENYLNAWEQGDVRHFLELAVHHRAGGAADTVPRSCVAFVVRPLQLPVQPDPAGVLHRGNLLPQQEHADPAVPLYREVPLPLWMSDSGSCWTAPGADPGQHRLPDRLLHLRAQQLHEGPAPRDDRGGPGRRGRRPHPVLPHHPAAVPAGPGRAGHPPGHLDLQRVLLGHGADAVGRQVPHHQLPHEPAGPVLHRSTCLGRVGGHRHPVLVVFFLLQKQFVAGPGLAQVGAPTLRPSGASPARAPRCWSRGRCRGPPPVVLLWGAGPGRRARGPGAGRGAGAGGGHSAIDRPVRRRCCPCRPTAGGCGPGWPAPGPTGAAGRRGSWSVRSRRPGRDLRGGGGGRRRGRAGPGPRGCASPLEVLEAERPPQHRGRALPGVAAGSHPAPAAPGGGGARPDRPLVPRAHPPAAPAAPWRLGAGGPPQGTSHDATLVLAVGTPGLRLPLGRGLGGPPGLERRRGPLGGAQRRRPRRHGRGRAARPLGGGPRPRRVYASPPLLATWAPRRGRPQRRLPPVPARPALPPALPRPVVLNTWEAVYFDHRLDRLTDLAEVAARLGRRAVRARRRLVRRPPQRRRRPRRLGRGLPTSGRTASTR